MRPLEEEVSPLLAQEGVNAALEVNNPRASLTCSMSTHLPTPRSRYRTHPSFQCWRCSERPERPSQLIPDGRDLGFPPEHPAWEHLCRATAEALWG